MAEHYVYKYVKDGEVIYVGKTNSNLTARINAHAAEVQFQKIAPWDIFVIKLDNSTQTGGFERLLIDLYHPQLNTQYVNSRSRTYFEDTLPWQSYNDIKEDLQPNRSPASNDNLIIKQIHGCRCRIGRLEGDLNKLREHLCMQWELSQELFFRNVDWDSECWLEFEKNYALDDQFAYCSDDRSLRRYGMVFDSYHYDTEKEVWMLHYKPLELHSKTNARDLFLADYRRSLPNKEHECVDLERQITDQKSKMDELILILTQGSSMNTNKI